MITGFGEYENADGKYRIVLDGKDGTILLVEKASALIHDIWNGDEYITVYKKVGIGV